MKYIKIFRTLVVALALALVVAVLPATPALAQGYIYVYPTKGEIDDGIEVYGYGFGSGASIDIYFSSDAAAVNDYLDTEVTAYERVTVTTASTESGSEGEIETLFSVPDRLNDGDDDVKVRGGTYYVYATSAGSKRIRARTEFTVEAVGEISIDPQEGTVGTEVEITGAGYDDREDLTVEYDGRRVDIESGDEETDRDGEFELTILIPESYAGDHAITVIGEDSDIEVMAEFTVEPKITISPESGVAGDTITVSGTGFGEKVDFSVFFGNDEVTSDDTDRYGSFEVTFAAPAKEPGSYDVEAEDEDYNSDKEKFTIAATTLSLSPVTGYVGGEVTVSGTGFRASQSISITFDNEQVKTASTDASGQISTSFTVPVRIAGTYKVKITDGTNIVEADFTISTSASISPITSATSPGYVGTDITVSGAGYIAGRTVTITYDGNQVATATVNANGGFSAAFTAPASSGGEHSVVATDGTNTSPFTFFMDSTSPAPPVPLKPEMNIQAEAEVYFDWEDVTDPSGVTYTLQIATDENFSVASIVLERTGLVQSEYTITEEERLQSVSEEAPYYWHVKAIDGASNESQWSGTGVFYVGFSFGLSQPIIYTIIGVGALVLILFAFWLGRKTAYY